MPIGIPHLSDAGRLEPDAKVAEGNIPKLVEENKKLRKALKAIINAHASDLGDLLKRARQLLKELESD